MPNKERKIDIILFGIVFIGLWVIRWWGFHLLLFGNILISFINNPLEYLPTFCRAIITPLEDYPSYSAGIYSVTYYILPPIGVIGIFFRKNWARISLIVFALIELNATFAGVHKLTFDFLHLSKPIQYLYLADGIVLAVGTLIFLNLKSVRERFKAPKATR